MRRFVLISFLAILVFSSPQPALAQNSDDHPSPAESNELIHSAENIKAGASLGYLFSDDINLVGILFLDFPFLLKSEKSAYFNLVFTNTVSKFEDSTSFKVRDFDYRIMLGARDYLTNKLVISAFVAQQGVEKVDKEGSSFIRYVGFSMESRDYRSFEALKGLSWYGELGAIFATRDVNGEITFKGDARFNYLVTDKLTYGIDFTIDSLINDFNTSNDWKIGPRITLCNPCSSAPSLFIYYMNNKNPLGFIDDGFIAGFDYRERAGKKDYAIDLPDIHGNISGGVGDGDKESRLSLKFKTPSFRKSSDLRIAFDFDTYILTGSDTGNLYYFLNGGLERERGGLIQGAYIYHRSNHQLAEPNDSVTYLNVIEAGLSSKGWDAHDMAEGLRIDIGPLEQKAVLNFMARAGFLLSNSYGEERKWNARIGASVDFPLAGRGFSPFISAYWEGGDVSRKEFSCGFRTPLDLDISLQYKQDEQYFGMDDDAFLLVASCTF